MRSQLHVPAVSIVTCVLLTLPVMLLITLVAPPTVAAHPLSHTATPEAPNVTGIEVLTQTTDPATTPVIDDGANTTSQIDAEKQEWRVLLPIAARDDGSCAPIPGESYSAIIPATSSADGDPPADQHPDLNLGIRGYKQNPSAKQGLVDYGGSTDGAAPQLYELFGDQRTPTFETQYQVYHWDWKCDCKGSLNTDWPATVSGMRVTPGEPLHVPDSGYGIGTMSGSYEALVLYASKQRITLKYTRDDNVIYGYTLHVDNVCVEPSLLALYEKWDAAGRDRLPALRAGQAFGRARGSQINVAIRDTGNFMDPRSRKDWWQGR